MCTNLLLYCPILSLLSPGATLKSDPIEVEGGGILLPYNLPPDRYGADTHTHTHAHTHTRTHAHTFAGSIAAAE